MPSDQSAVSVLIQEVLADPDLAHDDVFRRLLQAGLQDLIDAEATAVIGAGPYERTEDRRTRRNGKRPKKLATTAGEVDLAIPKLRQGSFFPSLLSPRKRVDKALYAVICSAWIEGISTRKVDDLVRALGNESGISRSTVSRICKASTTRSRSLCPGRWTTPGSPTYSWTPPMWMSGATTGWSPRPWWSPPASRPKAAARSWAWLLGTPRPPTFGPPSCAPCANGG